MRFSLLLAFVGLPLLCSSALAQSEPLSFVNEYIGTANEGQTFPATGFPFAMTQWTPQSRSGNAKCVAPYYFADNRIQGFRGSHFLSGSCTQDYGSLTIMPVSGPLDLDAAERGSSFNRRTEQAAPFRYAVQLKDYGIDAEITGTERAGLMRFRFNRPDTHWILVECNAAPGEGTVHIDPNAGEITCVNPVHRLYAGNGRLAGFNGYFVVRFNHPFHLGGTWAGRSKHPGSTAQTGEAGPPGAYISFDGKAGDAVEARIGSSFTSLDEARSNLQAEIPGWDITLVEQQAKSAWSELLDRIRITASPAQKRIFYTAMYHSMLLPRIFSDRGGTYPAFASTGKIETAHGFTYYCDYSLWDTFRALHPLLTLLDPQRERDMVRSLIVKGNEGGFLPIYPAWNSYTSEMSGDHADLVIADAWAKGIRGFDIDAAYRLMRHNATEEPRTYAEYVDGRGRRALEAYLKYGYIPLEDPVADSFHKNEQVSRTLDYAFDDFAVGRIAAALGKTADAEMFEKRSRNYRNVIDPAVGFARGRHADGSWITPFDPLKQATYVTEGLPIQFTFFVPQDIPGLIDWVGGSKAFVKKLDTLFDDGLYDQGNEPSHHIGYLYDNAGQAWKTQMRLRQVMETQYKDGPAGLAGNDDCGQMSAWYVFSALGFYPVAPGTPRYEIGTPLFDDARILLPSGRQLHIQATGAAAGNRYIRAATLNGAPLNRYWLTHDELLRGGDLVFEMTERPDKQWPSKD
jgi:predicted alpha-1,2-mannosidase